MAVLFQNYIGIDYSGAKDSHSPLPGLRLFKAEGFSSPYEISPIEGKKKYWSRKGVANWLMEYLKENHSTVIGIDHGFSFPLAYFEKYKIPRLWGDFLDDFVQHWPTGDDTITVDDVRKGRTGQGELRKGESRWKRVTEQRAKAKSVFHFDVPGSVAKSTHSGMSWLNKQRSSQRDKIHFWPFDGWIPPKNKCVILEAYPALYKTEVTAPLNMTPDQRDAYTICAWLQKKDRDGILKQYLNPTLDKDIQDIAQIEGWIMGVT